MGVEHFFTLEVLRGRVHHESYTNPMLGAFWPHFAPPHSSKTDSTSVPKLDVKPIPPNVTQIRYRAHTRGPQKSPQIDPEAPKIAHKPPRLNATRKDPENEQNGTPGGQPDRPRDSTPPLGGDSPGPPPSRPHRRSFAGNPPKTRLRGLQEAAKLG